MKRELKIQISGMTCSGCEETLTNGLKEIKGISKIKADSKMKSIELIYDDKKTNIKEIENKIKEKGYLPKKDNSRRNTIITLISLILAYILLRETGMLNFIPTVPKKANLVVLFIIGLLTSIHCVTMCGGINIAVTMNYQKTKRAILKPGILYNAGRVTSYTILGGLIGLLGSTVAFTQDYKTSVAIIVGVFMISLGLSMSGVMTIPKSKMPKLITKVYTKLRGKTTNPYLIGLLNGLMPCGPLQSMQLYALGTGSFINGALAMFAFSLGTVPLMLALSVINSFMSVKKTLILKKIGALLIIFLGVIMLNRGIDLNSVIKNEMNIPQSAEVSKIKGDYQEVRVRFFRGKYKPIVVQKDIPVKWIIEIHGGELNGCNDTIYIKEYDITKKLEFGDNIINFMPTKEGVFRYDCWMNMLKSDIYVVDDLNKIEQI